MPNPLIAQGTLNLARATLTWSTLTNLTVTPSYLAKAGMKLTFLGESTRYMECMTGAATSPEPYQMIELTAALNKANGLADLYKQQLETNALLGNGTLRTDTPGLSSYALINCSIKNIREISMAGDSIEYNVIIGGYYLVNSSMFDAA